MAGGAHLTALAIVVGAALVALWLDVRFPRLGPDDVKRCLVHLAASALLASVLVVPGLAAARLAGPTVGALVGVFGVAFPMLVYCQLASLWMLRLARALLPSR